MSKAKPKRRFDVALSFPGEHRPFVAEVAEGLARAFRKDRVLYDAFHEADFARMDLDVYLPSLYRTESELVVLFLCPEYAAKRWCKLEWRHIRQLIATADQGRIMLLSFGNPGDLTQLGILTGDGYADIGGRGAPEICDLIRERWNRNATAGRRKRTTSGRDPAKAKATGSGAKPSAEGAVARDDDARRALRQWLIERLQGGLTATLALARDVPAAVRRLNAKDGGTRPVPDLDTRGPDLAVQVAAALLGVEARIAAAAINSAHKTAVSGDRAVLQEVLVKVLPFATDLGEVRRRAIEADRNQQRWIEVPFRTETLGELVAAGIDCRPFAVTPVGATPGGTGGMPLPSSALAPLLTGAGPTQAATFAQNVAIVMCRQAGPAQEKLADIVRRYPNPRDVLSALQALLELLQEEHRWARYLLFIDEDLRDVQKGSVDDLWGLVRSAIHSPDGLDALRLIRLQGGPDQVRHEFEIAFHIREVMERR